MLDNMIEYLRYALYTVLIVLLFFAYQIWEKEHPVIAPAVTQTQQVSTEGRFIPQAPADTQANAKAQAPAVTTTQAPPVISKVGQTIKVATDVFNVNIDTQGGDVTQVQLTKYPQSLDSPTPITLLNDDPATRYLAESGLLSKQGPDTQGSQAIYTTDQTSYTMEPGQDTLTVKLLWHSAQGIEVTKVFTFTRGSYEINVAYQINNQSPQAWQGSLYTQLVRTDTPPAGNGGMVNLTTFFGAAISTPDKPFEKFTFSSLKDKPLQQTVPGGWAAMIQHYFISAWVPPSDGTYNYYAHSLPDGTYSVGMIGKPFSVEPNATNLVETKLYVGPSIGKQLEKTAPNLKLTIDYGWFWFISDIIFWMMQKIYDVVGNWGWSIVLVTVVIKLLFYQLSAKSYRSMRDLKRLQPKIESLRERYADDKQKLTQATLELYKQEKVNPMSGCLPILIQIPVFIALYWVLVESVELRQAPFIFWIRDLSQHDPYYILPLLMGGSMFLQQLMNPPAPDPLQQKMMMMMPIVFTVLFANFPAGLMLYWFVNNTLSFLQQWFVMHSIERNAKKKGNERLA